MVGCSKNNKEPIEESTSEIESTTENLVVEPSISETEKQSETTTQKSEEVIKPQEVQKPTPSQNKKPSGNSSTGKTNAQTPAKPVKPSAPKGTSQGNKTEIIDNGNDPAKVYNCGSKGHHCDGKETHDFIVSLEQKGCPYCGSHSCKSFYTFDEWGNACYDPTKCESYSAKQDPCEYCQECGKKIGDGSGSTCVRFTVDMNCPVCGKKVAARTCHTH